MALEKRNLFTRADQLKVRPIPMLIAGVLAESSLAGLVGASGSCKSFLGIAFACCVATGHPWFGRPVKQGAAFILAGEGLPGMSKRLRAWEQWTGVSLAGAPLYVSSGLACLCEQVNVAEIVNDANEIAEEVFFQNGLDPALFVIDTLARAMAGRNENSSEDMGALVGGLDWLRQEWGATVLVIHHAGLDPSAQDRGRGSSAFRAALDSEMVIRHQGDDLVVKTTKAKDWQAPGDIHLAKHEVEMFVPVPTEDRVPGGPTELRETSLVLIDRPGVQVQEDLRNRALDLHAEGHSERVIAGMVGVGKSTVHRWLAGAAPPRGVLHTPAVGQAMPRGAESAGQLRGNGAMA